MIIVASQRSGARALAEHLMNDRDNDHVTLSKIDGFMSDDLHGALDEAHAVSKATQCKQFLFSVSLNPPEDVVASEANFEAAADRISDVMGLSGQPFAMVIHEKNGRRHAHAVWSRIDVEEMKAINLPHFKNKMRDVSRDLFLDHGWQLPDGLATYGNKSPLNFTLEEWQQAKRQNLDPREIKQAFQHAWERSDNQISFKNALESRGYFLAKGDRRGFVALDVDGNIYAIPKWMGLKAKDVRAKLGSPEDLPSVADAESDIRGKVTSQMRDFISQTKDRQFHELEPLRKENDGLKRAHRLERRRLREGQELRWMEETKTRSNRLNKGLRGLFDRFSGKAKSIQTQNEVEARACARRDQKQRDFMVWEQLKERRALQRRFEEVKRQHQQERRHLLQSISRSTRNNKLFKHYNRDRQRGLGL